MLLLKYSPSCCVGISSQPCNYLLQCCVIFCMDCNCLLTLSPLQQVYNFSHIQLSYISVIGYASFLVILCRTPYLLFAFLYIDKYINWYQRLLSLTVGHKEQLKDIQYQLCAGKKALVLYKICLFFHPCRNMWKSEHLLLLLCFQVQCWL